MCFRTHLEKSRLLAHTQTLLQHYISQFPNSLLSCALNHPLAFFCLLLFPCGPPLSLSPLPPCLIALCLSHTPFSLFNSLFQSKYYLTSSQRLSTSQGFFFFPLLSPVCSYLSAPAGGSIELYFPGRKTPPLHACSGYSAVDWIKNKQGGIHSDRRRAREVLQQQSRDLQCS